MSNFIAWIKNAALYNEREETVHRISENVPNVKGSHDSRSRANPIPEEMSQTLLSNRKRGILD
jgi:hypothetical protein